MRWKWFAPLLMLLVGGVPAARGQDKAADAPAVIVRIQSLNVLLQNLNLVVKLVGQEEAANQIEALVNSKIGKNGIQGIDPARPFGAYLRFGKAIDEINGAILIPMADEKTFLTLLDNVGVNYAKDKDGIYTHKTNKSFDIYFRFAHDYLCITSVNTDSLLDKHLLEPAKALAVAGNAMVTMVARIDQIPSDAKLIALAQFEEIILAAQNKKEPGETAVQKEFRLASLREAQKFGSGLIREGTELRFDIDVNDKTKEMTVNLSVAGKPGSDLAKTIQELGAMQSPLASLALKDAAFRGAVHVALPDSLRKTFAAVIKEVEDKSLEGIQKRDKQKQAELFFKAMTPTTSAGEFQLVAAALGPKDKLYTFVAALKLKDGDQLGKSVHELLKDALNDIPPALREKIQLDFEKVGVVSIHRFEIPKNEQVDKLLQEAVGDERYLYLAFRDDAMFLALGKEALPALTAVVGKKDAVPSQPFLFEIDLARMAGLMAKTPDHKALAEKLFADGQHGRVRLSLEGGAQLHARLQMRLNVLEFLVKLKNDKEK